jgi:hypothetical protein
MSFFYTFLSALFLTLKAQAFTLNNSATLVFGKDEVKVNVANITCNNIGIDLYELKSIVADAVDTYWNKSPTSRLKLRGGEITNVDAAYGTALICNTSTDCVPNPTLAVASDILISCNNNTTNFNSAAILAITVPNNINGNKIVGSLILINDLASNSFALHSRAEKVSIIAHEIGHAFGLGHSPVKDSLMYFSTVNMRSSLGSDDIDGISYLYPKRQPLNCGSISTKNNPNSWLGLFFGLGLMALLSRFPYWYLKLRLRF